MEPAANVADVIRRSVLAVGTLLVALTLSSCSTLQSNDDVATVGDASLDRATFDDYISDISRIRDPQADTSEIGSDLARSAIARWIVEELSRQFLDEQGIDITDADRTAAEAQLDELLAAEPEGAVTDVTREFMIESIASQMVFQNSQDPGALGPFATTVDIDVDSRYGFWDGETGSVLAFG
jgi:hypothetical protein